MSVFHNNILAGASGAGGAAQGLYVDDVFSTFLLTGNGASSRSVQNGLDLDGEGGLVWFKGRDQSYDNALFDTERGTNERLNSNAIGASATETTTVTAFNSDGFTVGSNVYVNGSDKTYASWSFRKAPGFFDIVTYTGNGTAGRTVSHNLGSTPGAIIIKKYSNSENWIVYHRSVGATKFLTLNAQSAATTSSVIFNNTEPTSTQFTLGANSQVNENGDNYVAYVFAHDDQSFGDNSDEAIIKCGTYTGTGGSDLSVDLGFQPQFVLVKNADDSSSNWVIFDMMRGMDHTSRVQLYANLNSAEFNGGGPTNNGLRADTNGFSSDTQNSWFNSSGDDHVYIAIRHPHKPPAAGTDVFTADAAGLNAQAGQKTFHADHYVDLVFHKHKTSTAQGFQWFDRLRGGGQIIKSNNTNAELDQTTNQFFDLQDGVRCKSSGGNFGNFVGLMFKRAPGFFDIVAYKGTGSDQVVNHGLGVTPDLMILKARSTTTAWRVFYKDGSTEKHLQLNTTGAAGSIPASHPWSPTTTTFRADQYFSLSQSGQKFIAYAFANLPGISKVGLYSGSSSAVTVDCGFSSAPRFIMIKATNRSEPWYVFDSARGIVSGNDPHLQLQSTSVENDGDDVIDPTSSGFTVNTGYGSGFNESGNTYLFFAIA